MTQYVDLLSNREQASLILVCLFICIAVILGISQSTVRESILQLIRTFLKRAILLSLFMLFMYILLEVWIGYRLGWWNIKLVKDTIIWSVVSESVTSFV